MRVILNELRIECVLTTYNGSENTCQWCDNPLPEKSGRTVFCSDRCSRMWERNHIWRKARTAARRRDKYACVKCGVHKTVTKIEVNHINPLNGAKYSTPSCFHHLDNLETLCVDHHKEITKEQAKARAEKRKNPDGL